MPSYRGQDDGWWGDWSVHLRGRPQSPTYTSPVEGNSGVTSRPAGLLGSARTAGIILLVLPIVVGVALNLFPNYDARPEYFASSYSHILDAGNAYPASLGLLLVVAALLAGLVLVLRRSPAAGHGGGMLAVFAGLGMSAGGFASAAVLSIPVWLWADRVNSGALTFSEGAAKSESLASVSQTLILLLGLGGLVIGLTTLGVLSYRLGWTPASVFWVTIVVAAVVVVGGFALTLFWIALGVPPLLWTLMIGGSLVAKGSYATHP